MFLLLWRYVQEKGEALEANTGAQHFSSQEEVTAVKAKTSSMWDFRTQPKAHNLCNNIMSALMYNTICIYIYIYCTSILRKSI